MPGNSIVNQKYNLSCESDSDLDIVETFSHFFLYFACKHAPNGSTSGFVVLVVQSFAPMVSCSWIKYRPI